MILIGYDTDDTDTDTLDISEVISKTQVQHMAQVRIALSKK